MKREEAFFKPKRKLREGITFLNVITPKKLSFILKALSIKEIHCMDIRQMLQFFFIMYMRA